MKVAEWIRRNAVAPVTATQDSQVDEIIDAFLEDPGLRDVYLVDESRRVVGHLARHKLVHLILAEHRPVHTRRQLMERVTNVTARDLMNRHFAVAHPDDDLDSVLHSLLQHEMEDMPVVDDQRVLLGAVNLTSILRAVRAGELTA